MCTSVAGTRQNGELGELDSAKYFLQMLFCTILSLVPSLVLSTRLVPRYILSKCLINLHRLNSSARRVETAKLRTDKIFKPTS